MDSEPIDLTPYEFLDFGCSAGGSLRRFGKLFECTKPGLGLDISEEKVKATREAGFDAELCDLTTYRTDDQVRFVVMNHLLEHIPDMLAVQDIIATGCRLARDFVYIGQPYFDADPYLFSHGLKLYWSHWSGHTNHMTLLEFRNVLEKLRQQGLIERYLLVSRTPITDSTDPAIHCIDSPIDQHDHIPGNHSPKPRLPFAFPVFRESAALIQTKKNGHDSKETGNDSIQYLIKRVRPSHVFYDSNSNEVKPVQINASIEKTTIPLQHFCVTGIARSGTTALTKLLNSHPNMAVGIERYKYRFSKPLTDAEQKGETSRSAPLSQKDFEPEAFLDISAEDTNILPERNPETKAVYETIRERHKAGVLTWIGEKNPGLHRKLPLLAKIFPEMRFVYIHRDLMEIASSYNVRAKREKDMWPSENDARLAVKHWNHGVKLVKEFAESDLKKYLLILDYKLLFSGDKRQFGKLRSFFSLPSSHAFNDCYATLCRDAEKIWDKPYSLDEEEIHYIGENQDKELLAWIQSQARS